MNRKDLLNSLQNEMRREKEFGKRREILSKNDAVLYNNTIESTKYVQAYREFTERFIPKVEVRHPETFAFYGSAEQYYDSAFKYIHTSYPYDGSGLEKLEWSLSASALDLAVLQHEYPKETGFVAFTPDTWGTAATTSGRYSLSSDPEYIKFSGGPYVNSVLNASSTRESSLKIDGTAGNTLEFWMKKNSLVSNLTQTEVVFDSYTINNNEGTTGYGRFLLELSSSSGSPFHLTYMSGTAGMNRVEVGSSTTNASVCDNAWHHYAFTVNHSASNLITDVYVDGKHDSTKATAASTFGAVQDYFKGTIGALATAKDSTGGLGYGKLSGSLDEVRFWKTKRTAKDIGNYFDYPVNGATDSESINNILGLYYKFNEGTVTDTTQDKIVLDYSGRLNNGEFVGYASNNRNNNSAITLSTTSAETELGDPIINPKSSRVTTALSTLVEIGKEHDDLNNSSIFRSVPQWAYDSKAGSSNLDSDFSILLQAMASRFDSVKMLIDYIPQITRKKYDDFHFAKGTLRYHPSLYILMGCEREFVRNLASFGNTEVFSFNNLLAKNFDVKELPIINKMSLDEYLYNIKFSQKDEISNLGSFIDLSKGKQVSDKILNSVYYDIDAIYKKKGTHSAFRNLIRCFGVDEKLVAPNIYINNGEFLLKDNPIHEEVAIKSLEALDKNSSTTLHQTSSSTEERHYIQGKPSGSMSFEVRTVLPNTDSYSPEDVETSIFGLNEVLISSIAPTAPNRAGFVVSSVKDARVYKGSRFKLSSSAGFFTAITSTYFPEVFDNTPWYLSVRFSEDTGVSLANLNTKGTKSYKVEFNGYQYELDTLISSFNLSSSITQANYLNFMQANKSAFVGAERTGITGSVVKKTENKFISFAAWDDRLTEAELKEHAKSVDNIGRFLALTETSDNDGTSRAKADTLVLNWQFDDTTLSNNRISIADHSSGSLSRVRDFGNIIGYKYPASTTGVADTTSIVDTEHLYYTRYMPIDNAIGESKIEIKEREIDLFEIDSRPVSYIYSYEKSAYQVMSREMLRMIAGVSAFNNLIGEPIHKYRDHYKSLRGLRERFFSRIESDIDLERFIEYYKWVDSSLGKMLEQLQPATAGMKVGMEDVIESHVFERNKYKHQAPTFEFKDPDPNTSILGINELLYDWKHGHAPIPDTAATATWTFTDKGNETTTITLTDGIGASVVFEIDNDGDGAAGTNIAMDPPTNNGAGMATILVSAVNASILKITATNPSSGVVLLTQDNKGVAGNTAITLSNYSNWNANTSATFPTSFTGGSSPQSEHCLWWHDRAERDGILSVPGAPNEDRETLRTRRNTLVEGSTYAIRKLSRPYKFSVERSKIISVGSNRNANKNKDLYKVINSGKNITLNASDIYEFKRCDDVIDPQEEDIYTAKANVDGTDGYLDTDADMIFPFTFYSSSVGTDFSNFKQNLKITNNHNDESPSLQGPFVRESVGGMPHRRVKYLTPDADRPEAYILSASSTTLTMKQAVGPKSMINQGRQSYLNIANVKTNRNSTPVIVGNYDKIYEIVEAHGRSLNNRFLADSGSIPIEPISAGRVAGTMDYTVATRPRSEHVFVSLFSAPGGPETMSPGARDLESGEYSIYNTMNYRNLSVRTPLNKLHTERTEQFGYRSGSTTQASLHMTNRNYFYDLAENKKDADSFFIQHPIPQNDIQYGWITASTSLADGFAFVSGNDGFGHQHNFTSGSKSAIQFISSSTYQNPTLYSEFMGSSANAYFGYSVAIANDRAYVGAYGANSSQGKVVVIERQGNNWFEETELVASDKGNDDIFGYSISALSDVLAVGAPQYDGSSNSVTNSGATYIFERRGTNPWSETKILSGASANDDFGWSVSINGDNLVVGAPGESSNAGAAYVYNRKLGWLQTAFLTASSGQDASDYFGRNVAIDKKAIVVGAYADDPGSINAAGSAFVYEENGENNWEFKQHLTASNASTSDLFGRSVVISGDIIAVGASGTGYGGGSFVGSVYVFEKQNGTWVETQILQPRTIADNQYLGYGNLSIEDGNIFVGEIEYGTGQGAVSIYKKLGGTWKRTKTIDPSDYNTITAQPATGARFGQALHANGSEIIIGAYSSDLNSLTNNGSAYIFKKTGKSWADVDVNYAGVNLSIVDGVDEDTNTLAKITDATVGQLITHRQGPYGWPTWKQIRGYEHPVAKAHKKSNTFSRVYMGTPQKTDNFNKKALTLNGSDSYLQINDTRDIFAGNNYSVFAWIKHPEITLSTAHTIWGINSSVGGNRIDLAIKGSGNFTAITPGALAFYRTGGTGWQISSRKRIDDDEWHHVGFVYEKLSSATATIELYVDGKSQGDKLNFPPFDSIINGTTDLVSIGQEFDSGDPDPSDFFKGDIADFAIWDKSLTDAEVASLVEYSGIDSRAKGPIDLEQHSAVDNLKAWYRMGDGSRENLKDNISLDPADSENNVIYNNVRQFDSYDATPVTAGSSYSSAITIGVVSDTLPGDYFISAEKTIIAGSQDIATNAGYSVALDRTDDPYERARNLDTLGPNGDGTYDHIRVLKNYDEPSATVRYSPVNITIHGDRSYTPPMLNSIAGGWERGFDPRLPRFFVKRENTQKLSQLDRHRSWNSDSKYYKNINNGISLTEREALGNLGKYSISYGQVSLKKTFQNDIVTFANQQILKDSLTKEPITSEFIPFLDLLLEENDVQHHKLLEVSYSETVYPREVNTFSKAVRARTNFDFFGWNSKRDNRKITLGGNVQHKKDEVLLFDSTMAAFPKMISSNEKDYKKSFFGLYDAVDVSTYAPGDLSPTSYVVASSWVLDSRADLTSYPVNITSSFFNQSSSFMDIRDQGTRGEGLLQNDFSTFALGYNGLYGTPPFSLVYNRRIPQISGTGEYLAGEAKWEAASGTLGPFYDSYDEYAFNDIRLIAKDHSIVPEFRISQFVEEVLKGEKEYPSPRDRPDNPLSYWPDFLSLTGSIHSNEDGNLEISGQSFRTYSNSDFLRYFKVVDEEIIDNEHSIAPTRITLSCKAAMKFLPYRGFYPAERATQIYELFHKNYLPSNVLDSAVLRAGPESETTVRRYLDLRAAASKYQAAKPLFGPGVFMNSIKAGIAVDYPIFTGSLHSVRAKLPTTLPITGSWPTGNSNRLVPQNNTFTGSVINETADFGIPRIKSSVSQRVQFEDLLNPSNIYNIEVFDNEPHPSASLQYGSQKWNRIIERPPRFGTFNETDLFNDLGFVLNNNKKDFASQISPYTFAMQNFAAETVNFFIEDGHLTTAMSKPIDEPFVKDRVYKMRVRLSNIGNTMYDRHSAFGPPVDDSGTGLDIVKLTPSGDPSPSTFSLTFEDPNTYKNNLLTKTTTAALPKVYIGNTDGQTEVGFAGQVPYINLRFYRSSAAWSTQPSDTGNFLQAQIYVDIDPTLTAGTSGARTSELAAQVKTQLESKEAVNSYWDISVSGATLTVTSKFFGQAVSTFTLTDASDVYWFSGSGAENIISGKTSDVDWTGGVAAAPDFYTRTIIASTSSHGFAPYTPPFLDANSDPYVEITFTPNTATGGSKNYTAQEIIEASTFEYFNFNTTPNNASSNTNYKYAMAISASLNLGICASLRTDNIETTAEGTPFISENESPTGLEYTTDIKVDDNKKLDRWVIQTKWETPVLDFSNVKATALNLASGQEQIVSGSPWKDRFWGEYYSQGAVRLGKTPGVFMTGSTGMWHQKGAPPSRTIAGQRKGYYLVIEDVSPAEGLPLASKLGFVDYNEDDESVKSLKRAKEHRDRIGMVEDSKMIKEAVVAIPYVLREDLPAGSPNKIQFITLNTDMYKEALSNVSTIEKELKNIPLSNKVGSIEEYRGFLENYNEKTRSFTSDSPINAIEYQLFMMQDYILPPALDFRITKNFPYMMYFFQFRASLTKNDISNIWQNLYPESASSMGKARYSCLDRDYPGRTGRMGDTSYVSHYLDTVSLLGENYSPVDSPYDLFSPRDTKNKTRWLVFKVKERGKSNLEDIRKLSVDPRIGNIEKFEYIKEGKTSKSSETSNIEKWHKRAKTSLQFNWPYDYFSFVELVKLEAKIDSYTYKKTE